MTIFVTRAQQRDRDYDEYVAGYNAARDEAVNGKHCFCVCGCTQPVEHLALVTGGPVICPTCRKAGGADHFTIRPPVETFDWAKYEDPQPVRQPRSRSRGFSMRMRKRLHAQRQRLADAAADYRAATKTTRGEWRARKQVNLNGVVIPETVLDGVYAVRDDDGGFVRIDIKRPTGPLAGFVQVTLRFGDTVTEQGVQYPQPSRPGHPQVYQGRFAHLVKRLVDNPEQAKADAAAAMEAA